MSLPLNGESLPLLGLTRPQRIHYIDNLRATLMIAYIFHHAALEVGSWYLPVALLVNIDKYTLWGLFYFVSGYSSSLSLTSGSSDLRFFVSRTLKIGFPAWLYAIGVHRLLYFILTLGWDDVFHGSYVRLLGPVAYVSMLLLMDYMHLLIRWINRTYPDASPSVFSSLIRPNNREQLYSSLTSVAAFLSLFIFLRCLGIQLAPTSIYLILSSDFPAFDSPFSYIIAYVVGVNFDTLKEHINLSLPMAYASFIASLAASYASLGVSSQLSHSLSSFIRSHDQYIFTNAGLNIHTIFYALWSTFVFFTIPISVVSIFSRATWSTREWGFLARHTYPQMYINMIPVLVAAYYTGWISDVTSRVLVIGVFGVVVSWIGMLGCIMLWMAALPLVEHSRS